MQNEIALVHRNNQAFVSSREVAIKFGKLHSNVVRDIKNLIFQNKDNEHLERFFSLNFEEQRISLQNSPKRGRPPEPHYLMTRDGFTLLTMGFTGNRALEWKIKFIEAFGKIENMLLTEVPKLRARIAELEQSQAQPPKQLAGPRKGMIPVPVIEPNLWNEQEIVAWEMQPMDQVDELLITMAKLRHCNHIAAGLEQKKKVLTDKLVQEELNRRIEVKDLTTKRFALPKQQKKRRSKTTH